MASELPGHRQPMAKFRRTDTKKKKKKKKKKKGVPFLFFLSPIRAREAGAAALWPMAER